MSNDLHAGSGYVLDYYKVKGFCEVNDVMTSKSFESTEANYGRLRQKI